MIEKNEILILASRLSLNPDTIEKDYVLGWLLWGINHDNDLANAWTFKGGTSLKKCFFETFRFSEDLDFTISKREHLLETFLQEKFVQITDLIYEVTGIIFLKSNLNLKLYQKQMDNYRRREKFNIMDLLEENRGWLLLN